MISWYTPPMYWGSSTGMSSPMPTSWGAPPPPPGYFPGQWSQPTYLVPASGGYYGILPAFPVSPGYTTNPFLPMPNVQPQRPATPLRGLSPLRWLSPLRRLFPGGRQAPRPMPLPSPQAPQGTVPSLQAQPPTQVPPLMPTPTSTPPTPQTPSTPLTPPTPETQPKRKEPVCAFWMPPEDPSTGKPTCVYWMPPEDPSYELFTSLPPRPPRDPSYWDRSAQWGPVPYQAPPLSEQLQNPSHWVIVTKAPPGANFDYYYTINPAPSVLAHAQSDPNTVYIGPQRPIASSYGGEYIWGMPLGLPAGRYANSLSGDSYIHSYDPATGELTFTKEKEKFS